MSELDIALKYERRAPKAADLGGVYTQAMEHFAEQLKAHLHEQGFATVNQIIIERALDWSGEDSLFIWLLLDDAVSDSDLSWKSLRPLHEEAGNYALAAYPELYPYVRQRRVIEWQEIVEART